ncbi:Dolichyl-phosphate-mannose-protein mannosyltransferase-domain-containing protein [Pilobolus umbonatus]|nr:Dolichyl-phosphate-mannose-protein mannosyltransferase-domain-containing protein [Pilobolus umbonatus]
MLKRRHFNSSQLPFPDSSPPKYKEIYDPLDVNDEKITKTKKSYYSSYKPVAFVMHHPHMAMATLLTFIALWSRFRLIDLSDKVVWDEAHFGKFGSYYLKHEFYFDVHPPLGKMLVGLSGYLANYNGSFSFESGRQYPEYVDRASMRIFNAAWGAMTVPLAYGTAVNLNLSLKSSLLAATMVLLDNALLTISRFILLDSMLLFFTSASLFTLSGFNSHRDRPFTLKWWAWLFSIGLSLGCVLSVKWVGLFAVALVGISTVEDLWGMLGDLDLPKRTYFLHWAARGVCLIAIPAVIYVSSFVAHFAILDHSGPGDSQMSSLFQAGLKGSIFGENPLEVAYGSNVTIKNGGYGSGLLHSHNSQYIEGSKQQQITGYGHRDSNNDWQIMKARSMHTDGIEDSQDEIEYVRDGDIVRLQHLMTKVNLHSHPISAPLSSKNWEVSGYGNEKIGDIQDNWKVEVVHDLSQNKSDIVKAILTRFRLRHVLLDCLLATSGENLPDWGFNQNEIMCDRNAKAHDSRTIWNIEEHKNQYLPPAPSTVYKTSFLDDFWHLNVAMWKTNNALVPNPDRYDLLASTPYDWPLVSVGLRMCGWDENTVKYYLLAYSISLFIYTIRRKRQIDDMTSGGWDHYVSVGKLFLLGWFLHYVPFFMMGRVTYLHHYFPALYFSIFMVPFLMEHFFSKASVRVRNTAYTAVFTVVILNFIHFAPLSYGMEGDIYDYSSIGWFDKWNLLENLN